MRFDPCGIRNGGDAVSIIACARQHRAGDTVGCFSLKVFHRLDQLGACFLSRCKHGLNFYDPKTGEKLDRVKQLKAVGRWDQLVLVGEERVLLRRVAEPVSAAVANERRRQARKNRDKRLRPGRERR